MSKPTSTIIDQNIDSDLGLLLIKYKKNIFWFENTNAYISLEH